jgi:hypothetical protein
LDCTPGTPSPSAHLLDKTAQEEGDADRTLTVIAQACVNLSAINGVPSAMPTRSLARGSGPRASRRTASRKR